MKGSLVVRLLALALFFLPAIAPASSGGDGAIVLEPGTSTVSFDDVVFEVTTDVAITLTLDFVSEELLEGQITVVDALPAAVQILWRDEALTVFQGTVVGSEDIDYPVPEGAQSHDDSGHVEK